MAGKQSAIKLSQQTFTKYTLEPKGIWARIGSFFQIDPKRSSGVPLNPLFRNPTPAGNDPKLFQDPVTLPAGDLAENPYWKRDVRRQYPQLSVMTQGDVVGLLTVGSQAKPKDDVLQIGDAGAKQLVALKEEGKQTGLAAYFQKGGEKDLSAVLGPSGMPPMPVNLAQGTSSPSKRYDLLQEQSYSTEYPCRNFQ